MKQKYIKPSMEVFKMASRSRLLVDSPLYLNINRNSTPIEDSDDVG